MHSLHSTYRNRLHIPCFALALVLLIYLAFPTSSCTEKEKGSLLQFLEGISQCGGLAASWLNATDCCSWEGITCSPNGAVIEVSLASRSLKGNISLCLANLTGLQRLNLSHNSFSGVLPLELISSSSIVVLDVSFNQLIGDLNQLPTPSSTTGPPLQVLNISSNLFTGQLTSTTWKMMVNLVAFNASRNRITGQVPTHFCTSSASFTVLALCYNQFSGSIPPGLGNCSILQVLKASYNNISGAIPNDLFNATLMEYLSFANNDLHGVLVGAQFIKLSNLTILDLGGNQLGGKIPDSIAQLKRLKLLDFSNNHLTGAIPAALNSLNFLSAFNISNNDLEGPIPSGGQFNTFESSSFNGNPKLCGSMLTHNCGSASTPIISTKERKATVLATAFGVFFGGLAILLLLGRLIISFLKKGSTTNSRRDNDIYIEATSSYSSREPILMMMRLPHGNEEVNKLRFVDILETTNNFHPNYIIGQGGCGLVYKAELPDGYKLAIKKLNGDMYLMEREFTAEVEALSLAQHENLVPLLGYCIQGDSRFLIYCFMDNGSLDDWLHSRNDDASSHLDWPTRLKIAQGASQGLAYIHNVCRPHIVHRDVKSSNILLDKEFKAYLADFGLARLILPNQTHVTTELVGTKGYIPPEYGQGWVSTLRGDMYSFGVVLLELLTGRQPVQATGPIELIPWVRQMRCRGKKIEVLDPTLRGRGDEEQMVKVLEIAWKCVDHDQFKRPTIMDVVSCLDSLDADMQSADAEISYA